MWLVRPAQPADLGDILRMVRTRGRGLSSTLPRESHTLESRIVLSGRSFADRLEPHERGRFLFVLEDSDTGRVRGVSAIDARAGNGEPFYNYRRDYLIHASHELGISTRVEMLFPAHAMTDSTLLCGFAIEAELVESPAFQLLSRARLLFLAEHRHFFADRIAVEIQGVQDENGQVPFWNAIGGHFFDMDFKTADQYSSKLSKTFIAELMPPNPIYVTLLSEAAQAALGQANHAAKPACRLLENEGFEQGCYVDIFDAGPVLEADTDQLRTVRNSRVQMLASDYDERGSTQLLAAGQGSGFRAVLGPAAMAEDRVKTALQIAQLLNCRPGDKVRLTELSEAFASC